MSTSFAWIFAAYVVGTLPSPYLIARAARRSDLLTKMRRPDSRGDAHFLVTRQLGKAFGVFSIVLDMVKGFVPALLARQHLSSRGAVAGVAIAAVAGHCYPPYLRRSGGRGLTTAAGVALALVPKAMIGTGLISIAGMAMRQGGLGTSVGFGLLPAFAAITGAGATGVEMCAGIVAMIAVRRLEGLRLDHRDGASYRRIVLSRLLFDLPSGRLR